MSESTMYIESTEQLLSVVGYLADAGVWFEVFRNENAARDFEVSVDPRNATVLAQAMQQQALYGFVNYGRTAFPGVLAREGEYPIPGEDPHTEAAWENVLDHLQDWAAELGDIFHLRPHYLVPVPEQKVKAALRELAAGRVWCADCGRYTVPEHQNEKRCVECGAEYDGEDPLAAWLAEKP